MLNIDFIFEILFAMIAASAATHFYLLRSKVRQAAIAEAEKKYGKNKMRQFMGLPQTEFSQGIKDFSQDFCAIFEQAEYAEQDGYELICGLGYGKALEFLIKDYAILNLPAEKGAIIKSTLSDCIKNYSVSEIRESAHVARLLRNDQTHYERSYLLHGSPELKELIVNMVTLIEQIENGKKLRAEADYLKSEMDKNRKTS